MPEEHHLDKFASLIMFVHVPGEHYINGALQPSGTIKT